MTSDQLTPERTPDAASAARGTGPGPGDDGGQRHRQPSDTPNAASFARLAGRMSRWTSNLLLTAIIILVAILFGSRLTQLWQPTPPIPPAEPQAFDFLDDLQAPLRLSFGNAREVITRQHVSGGREVAMQQLCEACAETAGAVDPPTSKASDAEKELLKRLTDAPPIRGVDAGAQVYQLDANLPMVVGVRSLPPSPTGDDGEPDHRVVSWAVASRGLQGGWNLYVFSPQPRANENIADPSCDDPGETGVGEIGDGEMADAEMGAGEMGAVEIPPPPSAEHLLSIGAVNGAAVMAFRGNEDPAQWAKFYDDWFAQRKWETVVAWQSTPHTWSARYRRADTSEVVDIHIQRGQRSTESTQPWRGVVTHTIGSAES